MSCSICARSTIDMVVSAVRLITNDDSDCRNGDELGKSLMRLNNLAFVSCYESRHREQLNSHDTIENYTWNWKKHSSVWTTEDKIKALVALNCLIYQCCEGDIDQTSLYQQLVKTKIALCSQIISELPAYQAATNEFWK